LIAENKTYITEVFFLKEQGDGTQCSIYM